MDKVKKDGSMGSMLPEHPRLFQGTHETRTHLKGILITSIRSALTRRSLLNNRTLQMDKITISIYLDIHICLSINFQFQPKPDTELYTCDITSCHKCQLSTDLQGVMTYIISLVQSMWWILSGGGSCHV